MKYFVDDHGLICQVDSEQCNHPRITSQELTFTVDGEDIFFIAPNGEEVERYKMWDSLISLAVNIERPTQTHQNDTLSLDEAIKIAHERVERYKEDYLEGNQNEGDMHYPLSLPADNAGVYFEQIVMEITEN